MQNDLQIVFFRYRNWRVGKTLDGGTAVYFIKGIQYNLRGFREGIADIRLFLCGFARFALVVFLTIILAGFIVAYQGEILEIIWPRPQNPWLGGLWSLISWIVSLFLVVISAIFSYLISQILFSVLIMDFMSRLTERKLTGKVREPQDISFWKRFFYLIRQEVPRAVLPLLLSTCLMAASWFIALGPLMILITSGLAIIFLAWDNTDLVPARRMVPFRSRLNLLLKNIMFHLGFGLPFLVPGVNLLFLSFAPVGGTLFYIERFDTISEEPA